jgi:hypothetical protein
MRKIKLDLDEVQVDSYPTEKAPEAENGTVRAMSGFGCDTSWTCYSATDPIECPCQRKYTNEWEC